MDSMTEKELDSDGKCFTDTPTRMTRIARGSGTSVREVEDVLTQHRMMAGMAKKMGKGMANMQKAGAMSGPGRQQQMAAMQRRMQSMGGGGGAGPGAGGMPNMADMMKMLGGGAGGMPGMGGAGGANPFAGMDMGAMMQQLGGMMGGGGAPNLGNMMGGGSGGGGRGRR